MPETNKKALLERYYQDEFTKFKVSDAPSVDVPIPSLTEFARFERKFDRFEKAPASDLFPAVKFIKKNNESEGMVWRTSAAKLREAVRWGVVNVESATGKVVGALGRYRLIAHERVMKGMISNTALLKDKLLSHYQNRIELFQPLECWVNQAVPPAERTAECADQKNHFLQTIRNTIKDLEKERATFKPQFNRTDLDTYSKNASAQIRKDIQNQINRLKNYLHQVENAQSIKPFLRATGNESVLEFVKCEGIHSLYAMQGINQDCTYSRKRRFAATRGELNSCIEDARKEINDYRADLRNATTDKHHGIYGRRDQLDKEEVFYDFAEERFTAEGQRQALLAISFVEGYDKLDFSNPKKPKIISKGMQSSRNLTVIHATSWRTSRSVVNYFKRFGYNFLNMVKSIFFKTRPWEKEFYTAAGTLREHAIPNDPLWYRPVKLLRIFWYNFRDVFKGLLFLVRSLFVDVPSDVANDYSSTDPVRYKKNEFVVKEEATKDKPAKVVLRMKGEVMDNEEIVKKAEKKLRKIQIQDWERLKSILKKNFDIDIKHRSSIPFYANLAHPDYHLTPGDQNDLLSASARGLNEFVNFVSHNIFAKDPVAGLMYTSIYALGGLAVLAPQTLACLGPYIQVCDAVGKAMGSSKVSAAVANAVTQAQAAALLWNVAVHGPKSWLAQGLEEICSDPVTAVSYFLVAYWVGYFLANGAGGYDIPWLSKHMREDLGSIPGLSYPVITLKVFLLAKELFQSHQQDPFKQIQLEVEAELRKNTLLNDKYKEIQKYHLIAWLSMHQGDISRLKPTMLFNLERVIRESFTSEEADSLCKILYPEKPRSIAYQIFAIPLNYIPAILRLLISPVVSVWAWIQEREDPWAPMQRAGSALYWQTARDLTRLVVFAKEVLTAVVSLIVTPLKMVANVLMLSFCRVAGWFGFNPGHDLHVAAANVHVAYLRGTQAFNPGRTLQSVQVAHPNHTVRVIKSSYARRLVELLNDLSRDKEDIKENIKRLLSRAVELEHKSERSRRTSSMFESLTQFAPSRSSSASSSSSSSTSSLPESDSSGMLKSPLFSTSQ